MSTKTPNDAVKAGQSIPGDDDASERPSVRDSIRAAIEEHTEVEEVKEPKRKIKAKAEDDEQEEIKDDAKEVEDTSDDEQVEKKPKKKEEKASEEISDENQETNSEEKESEAEADKAKTTQKAHTSLTKEYRDSWAKLPQAVQQAINRDAKALSDLRAEAGRNKARYQEMDAAIAPYSEAITKFGVSPAQTVSRLFQWMDALSGPQKLSAFQQLAQDFGVNIAQLTGNNGQQQQQQTQQYQPDNSTTPRIEEQLAPVLAQFDAKIKTIEQQYQQNSQRNADDIVHNWAGLQQDGSFANKPYFGEVRGLMATLIKEGAIPPKNGRVDLDAAYDMACHAHPMVRERLQEEAAEANAQKAAADLAAKKAKIAKAKAASVGIRPNAPSADLRSPNPKSNGKQPSPRDSIIAAIAEVRNQ
jgi:hypothetical protein